MIKIETMTATTTGKKFKVTLSDGRTVYVDSETAIKFHLDTSTEYDEEEFGDEEFEHECPRCGFKYN